MADSISDQTKISGDGASRHARSKIGKTGEKVLQHTDEMSHKAKDTVNRYPIMTIAGAAMAGLVAGALMRR